MTTKNEEIIDNDLAPKVSYAKRLCCHKKKRREDFRLFWLVQIGCNLSIKKFSQN